MEEINVLIATADEPFGEYLYHQLIDPGWTISRAGGVSELLMKVRGEKGRSFFWTAAWKGFPPMISFP